MNKDEQLKFEQDLMKQIEAESRPAKIERVKIETPLGSIESDSGSHFVDVMTVICVIAVLYLGKRLLDKYLGRLK